MNETEVLHNAMKLIDEDNFNRGRKFQRQEDVKEFEEKIDNLIINNSYTENEIERIKDVLFELKQSLKGEVE